MFELQIEQLPDGRWIATIPGLASCCGASKAEAIARVLAIAARVIPG